VLLCLVLLLAVGCGGGGTRKSGGTGETDTPTRNPTIKDDTGGQKLSPVGIKDSAPKKDKTGAPGK
jgi:hypothetical protein